MASEFRQNIVSGEWILFATDRANRPHAFKPRANNYQPIEECPFEKITGTGVRVIPNQFPLVTHSDTCPPVQQQFGFNFIPGNGNHEIVVFPDHERTFHDFSAQETAEVFRVYRERYLALAKEPCAMYVSIFHNYGHEAGASVYHPHSQIITTPILPPDVMRSLHGAYKYYKKHGREVYDYMTTWSMEQNTRIVMKNDDFVALVPFAARVPYEVRIYPRQPSPHFETITDDAMLILAEMFNTIMRKIKYALHDPAYNFFIHTAPVREDGDASESSYYRWHVEIFPRLTQDAGFEHGTGFVVNTVDPETAAAKLREA